MCYPGFHLIDPFHPEKGLGSPWNSVFPVGTEVADMVVRQHQPATTEMARIAGRGGEGPAGGAMKQCVCSPTRHPGSFRCRHHHTGYQWAGRPGLKSC